MRNVGRVDLVAPDDPWASYARTVVTIARHDATDLVVEAAPPCSIGAWPWASARVVHVLTAWDPGDARPGDEENRRRQAALEVDLAPLAPEDSWPAVGVDPVSAHREEGVAVSGLDVALVMELGVRYGQDAIFEWTPAEWAIVACRGERRAAFGWSVAGG
jgi:hypothetical protein